MNLLSKVWLCTDSGLHSLTTAAASEHDIVQSLQSIDITRKLNERDSYTQYHNVWEFTGFSVAILLFLDSHTIIICLMGSIANLWFNERLNLWYPVSIAK